MTHTHMQANTHAAWKLWHKSPRCYVCMFVLYISSNTAFLDFLPRLFALLCYFFAGSQLRRRSDADVNKLFKSLRVRMCVRSSQGAGRRRQWVGQSGWWVKPGVTFTSNSTNAEQNGARRQSKQRHMGATKSWCWPKFQQWKKWHQCNYANV